MLAALLLVLAVLAANLITAPYVLFKPGRAYDVLSDEGPGDAPVLSISGHDTHPTEGSLRMTTIGMYGGPGHEVSWWDVGMSYLGGRDEILPRSKVFPEEVTQEQVDQRSTAQMVGSQSGASTVALRAAGVKVTEEIVVAQVLEDAPAAGRLEVEDVVRSVDGHRTGSVEQVQQRIRAVEAGESVRLGIERDGSRRSVTVPTERIDGRTVVGVALTTVAESPVDVTVEAGSVGGPSAGMMLALGIYDKLTEGALTGGEDIAGTGTIDSKGQVGPIDGIEQKMAGAREAGATWFLAPDDNCEQVVGHVPKGMRAIAVTDFQEARRAVEAIADDRADDLPTCEQELDRG